MHTKISYSNLRVLTSLACSACLSWEHSCEFCPTELWPRLYIFSPVVPFVVASLDWAAGERLAPVLGVRTGTEGCGEEREDRDVRGAGDMAGLERELDSKRWAGWEESDPGRTSATVWKRERGWTVTKSTVVSRAVQYIEYSCNSHIDFAVDIKLNIVMNVLHFLFAYCVS